MTKNEFIKQTEKRLLILDGATGVYLQKCGMPEGVCPEKWIVEHRDVMISLQRAYVDAGSDIIYAPTFTGSRVKLAQYGLEEECKYLNTTLVQISKEAAGNKALVAGDMTMTGEQLSPMGTLTFEELYNIYKEQAGYLFQAGVDLFVVETMMSLQEARAALLAIKEVCDLPVMVTLTFQEDGRTLYGTDPAAAVVVLQQLGAAAIGMNCSTGPDKLLPLVKKMKEYAAVPIIAKPNAGLPYLDENKNTAFDMNPDDFAAAMEQLVKAGANIIGGCCGTTPEYIRKMTEAVGNLEVKAPRDKKIRVLASERELLPIDLNGPTLVVGERINPTGKKKVQAELKEMKFDRILEFAIEQGDCGAHILDVNVGMGGIDEKAVMIKTIEEVTAVSGLPLSLDTSHVEVMEAALRHYPGRALMNSISLEEGKAEAMLPLARKYGAMFILLPLTEKGLPKDLNEKKQIIHTLMNKALYYGLEKEDIVVDGLVGTIGANKHAAVETLETIRYCREELGLATIVGLSNISFGIPQRGIVNGAFLTMAIQNGLTMAISNPCVPSIRNAFYTADFLADRANGDMAFLEAAADMQEITVTSAKTAPGGKDDKKPQEQISSSLDDNIIYQCVVKGSRSAIVSEVKKALSDETSPSEILNSMLIPGINKVSELFEKQIYFLPQLIASAEAMKNAIDVLEPLLLEETRGVQKPKIVMATVKGDIHDIGKNLVIMMLKNYGYRIIDLGKDVDRELIIETAIRENVSIIGLSALMTTTMQEMKKVIDLAREKKCKAKIIVGGAVVTQEYADEIGADGYSKDASEAVKLVERLLDKES